MIKKEICSILWVIKTEMRYLNLCLLYLFKKTEKRKKQYEKKKEEISIEKIKLLFYRRT